MHSSVSEHLGCFHVWAILHTAAVNIEVHVSFEITALSGYIGASQVVLVSKNLSANEGDIRDVGSIPGSGRSAGGGHGNPLQCSCLENSYGHRSLVVPSPQDCKELDMPEVT